MFEDEAAQWQLDRINRLVGERYVTGRVAARIIKMLEEEPERNISMGSNKDINKTVKERIEREP